MYSGVLLATNEARSGVYGKSPNIELRIALGKYTTVFLAEVLVILKCVLLCLTQSYIRSGQTIRPLSHH